MGLSNEKRFRGIAYGIRNMVRSSKYLKSNFYNPLKDSIKDLWPSFRRSSGDSSFWAIGSCLSHNRIKEYNPISLTFNTHLRKDLKEYSDFLNSDPILDKINILDVINDNEKSLILEIYNSMESVRYSLNRYDDDFNKSLSELDTKLTMVEFELFEIFENDSDYFKAWLLTNILNKLIIKDENDFVYNWVKEQSLHLDFRISDDYGIKDLSEIYFGTFQNSKIENIPLLTRIKTLLLILGRRYHISSEHEKFLKMVEENNFTIEEVEEIKQCLENCKTNKENYTENSYSYYNLNQCLLGEDFKFLKSRQKFVYECQPLIFCLKH